jgi:CH-like domain in sperm protein
MINNFSHLQPTMKTLNIRFDSNIAASIMEQREGVALNILHQLKNVGVDDGRV